ncbi:hypothetical protein [Magnetospirillum sp. UT-4]|uniref:hypothetical protein n=1 Tax=Magnetospirillum sp. UT-4 TaxID=2681467 RepID=UPI001381AFAF|nr:hypothetical protein [Magnetospirillum sp. UT-4]CAA7618359.1 exported hypothetical protein [Magnetospirillum sp. UT-4]
MDAKFLVAGAALLALAQPAAAQWNDRPWSYGGGGAGMSTAARQAIMDAELFGSRPRNLVRSGDGQLLRVIERDNQAFLAEREPNVLAGPSSAVPLAGLRFGVGGVGGSAAIDSWTAMVDTLKPLQ